MASQLVIISSTARDLPEHREEVRDACLRQGMLPVMMEHLPAADAGAVEESLRMVDKADLYLGVFAHRYGYVPEGREISVTEMEYERATEKDIPRLIFLMDKSHPISIDDVEMGEGAVRLKTFKARLEKERVVNYFNSPADLRAKVIDALSRLRRPDLTTFHYVSDIPEPPQPFIAHPYTLLQTHRLVGRQPELNLLTDWVVKPDAEVHRARILNVVAVGGMGKSALTWQWFNDIAPQEMKPLAGRMWWSFYESDATFENFVTRALAYITCRPFSEVQQVPASDRERELLLALDREPFLLVLDGLERILIAYARMDAARLEDSQVGTQRNLRKTTDPRVGGFLRRLALVKRSRTLVSTRLYLADLETEGGDPSPGSFKLNLEGLTDEDAVELWRALQGTGSRDLLLPVFVTFDKHPLLIQALAGEVKRYRRAPGNFEEWRKANPRFDPTKFPLLQDAMSHVLEFALRGLDDKAQQVLHTIAAFRMPARYDTLAALLIGEGKPSAEERELDEMLTELEDRGLVGWDKRANRYDLHPLVRGVVWVALSKETQRDIYEGLRGYFESVPPVPWREVNRLDDLFPVIELYNTLCELGRYDEATRLFTDRLKDVFYHLLIGNREITELLERLFDFDKSRGIVPRPIERRNQATALNRLGVAYKDGGKAAEAAQLFQHSNELCEMEGDPLLLISGIGYAAEAMEKCGRLYESEAMASKGLRECRRAGVESEEPYILLRLGMALEARGKSGAAARIFHRGVQLAATLEDRHIEGYIKIRDAENRLTRGEASVVWQGAKEVLKLIEAIKCQRCLNALEHLIGLTALVLGKFDEADTFLNRALDRATSVYFVVQELEARIRLSELRRRQGELDAARELLEDVFGTAENSPYPLLHSDALNLLAAVERDACDKPAAVKAAEKAYRLAWCDGPPFAYHWGLTAALRHLEELGAPEPEMPPFDASRFEPIPDIEIGLDDDPPGDDADL